MRRRVLLPGAIVAALFTLAFAAPGMAGFKSGQYVGTTSQDDQVGQPLNVGLQVPKSKRKVKIVYFEFVAPPCGPNLQFAGEVAKLRRPGRFKFVDEFGYGYIKGKFEGRKATGTARYTFEPNGCDSGVVEWKAKKSS